MPGSSQLSACSLEAPATGQVSSKEVEGASLCQGLSLLKLCVQRPHELGLSDITKRNAGGTVKFEFQIKISNFFYSMSISQIWHGLYSN